MQKFIAFFLLIYLHSAFSQIVNIENKRLSESKQGFSGSADLNLSYIMNTSPLFQLGDKLKVGYRKNRHFAFVLTDHAFVKSTNNSFVNRGYEHIRYNYHFRDTSKFIYEIFQQGQFNKIQRIDLRLLLGSGLRFLVIDKKNYQLNLGTSLMLEYERLSDIADYSFDVLNSSYISFDGQFNDNFGMNTITYFQPKFIDFGNYRMANETSFRIKFSQHFTFKIVYTLAHDSRDIEGVRKTNYTINNTFSFNF